jgi:phosphate-selective porin OprO/OprP
MIALGRVTSSRVPCPIPRFQGTSAFLPMEASRPSLNFPQCVVLGLALFLVSGCSRLHAQEYFPEESNSKSLESEIELLKLRLNELESAKSPQNPAASTPPSRTDNSTPASSEPNRGQKKTDAKSKQNKEAEVPTDKWSIKMGGHIQMDYINWAQADPAIPNTQDYFEFRRLRLTADGAGYDVFDFRLQMTMEPESVGESPAGTVTSPEVKDAYFSMNEIPLLGRMRIGNFFVPFSLEQVTNDTNNMFLERSIPTQGIFSPDREVGFALYNCNEEKNLTWSSGIFFDSVSEALKERIDDNQGCRLSGRLTWLPYYDASSNGRYLIHTGLGVLQTWDQDNRVRIRARPQIREGTRIIDSGFLPADEYTIGNIESAVVWGRFTVQSEAFLASIDRSGNHSDRASVAGVYVHTSFFLTGENRIFERFGQHGAQFARNVPISNFSLKPGSSGTGAWEAKARWSYLDLNNIESGQYNDFTFGLNWYWSDRIRMMFDWIHPITDEQAIFGATRSDILGSRFDFNW